MGIKERRAQEKQFRLNQILDAARQLLFTSGIDSISISKIAKQAELGVGTIYFYFKNKEEIFVALQEEGLALFLSHIQTIDAQNINAADKLQMMAQAYYHFGQEHKDYLDIINMFLSSSKEFFNPDLKNKVDMSGSKIFDLIESVIVQGIKTGRFQKVDARKYAIAFFGSLHGLLQLKKLEKTALHGENHREIFNFTVDRLIKGIAMENGN